MTMAITPNRAARAHLASSTRPTSACNRDFSMSSTVLTATMPLASARVGRSRRSAGADDDQRRHLGGGVDLPRLAAT